MGGKRLELMNGFWVDSLEASVAKLSEIFGPPPVLGTNRDGSIQGCAEARDDMVVEETRPTDFAPSSILTSWELNIKS